MTGGASKPGAPTDPAAELLTDGAELLYRQVHPSWIKDGQPSSQAFKPTTKDEGRLSTARAAKITAEAAFIHHTGTLGLASAGSWAVTVGEVGADPVPLQAFADPVEEPKPDPAHAYIAYPEDRKAIDIKAKLLKVKAHQRGCLHPSVNGM